MRILRQKFEIFSKYTTMHCLRKLFLPISAQNTYLEPLIFTYLTRKNSYSCVLDHLEYSNFIFGAKIRLFVRAKFWELWNSIFSRKNGWKIQLVSILNCRTDPKRPKISCKKFQCNPRFSGNRTNWEIQTMMVNIWFEKYSNSCENSKFPPEEKASNLC